MTTTIVDDTIIVTGISVSAGAERIVVTTKFSALAAHRHTKADITDFSDGDYATAAQGAKADGAIPLVGTPTNGQVARFNGTDWVPVDENPGVTNHGALTGLSVDDHPQYHNNTRGDIRYTPRTELATILSGYASDVHTHTKAAITDFSDSDYATAAQGAAADTALQSIPSNVVLSDDVRLSDARTPLFHNHDADYAPITHTHTKAQITDFNDADYATANQGALAVSALQSLPAHNHDGLYATTTQGALADSALQSVALVDITDVDLTGAAVGEALVFDGNNWVPLLISGGGGGGGTSDHGALLGLGDDDHTQYHTDARGDTRYYTKAQADSAYATAAQGALAASAIQSIPSTYIQTSDARLTDARTPLAHNHTKGDLTDFNDADYATSTQGAKADSSLQNLTGSSVGELVDVDITSTAPTTGEVLAWNGTNFVPSAAGGTFNGGDITEDLTIDKANANLLIDATTGTTPRLTVQRDGVKTFEVQGLTTRALLRRFHDDGNGENRLEMYDDSTRFDHEVRGIAATNAAGFVTKAQVEAMIAAI